MTPPARILAARGGALGDFILTLPALFLLRRRWPDAAFHLMAAPAHAALAAAWGLADAHRSPHDPAAAAFCHPQAPIDPAWAAWAGSFDLVVSWLPDAAGTMAARFAECGAQRFLQASHQPVDGTPAWRSLAAPVAALTGLDAVPFVRPRPRPDAAAPRVLAVHPGSGGRTKIWPAARWLEALRQLHRNGDCDTFLIVTGECETDSPAAALGPELAAAGIPVRTLHQPGLVALADALADCTLFTGHDSGVGHLAAASGVPCLLLFGPTDRAVWAPPGASVVTAPDGQLERLEVDLVVEAIRRALG